MSPKDAQLNYEREWALLNQKKLNTKCPIELKKIRQSLSALSIKYIERFELTNEISNFGQEYCPCCGNLILNKE